MNKIILVIWVLSKATPTNSAELTMTLGALGIKIH